MRKNTRCTIVPQGIVELWFTTEFVCSDKHRSKEGLDFLLWSIDWIHIDLVLTIVGSEFDDIIFFGDNIDEFILIEHSPKSIE